MSRRWIRVGGQCATDGLVELAGDGLCVTPRGRFFLRNACMPFDATLAQTADRPLDSRTV
jgi:coproporphyrinogen III oxidase-like Fe-S oxidoreductase